MARPIATPPLHGQAAIDFFTSMQNVKKLTLEERKRMEKGADRVKAMLTFTF